MTNDEIESHMAVAHAYGQTDKLTPEELRILHIQDHTGEVFTTVQLSWWGHLHQGESWQQ